MNDVALVMKGHPEIRKLRVEVYAPGVPKAETQKRADAVRDFLISKGVDGGRIEAVGQGAGAARIDFNVTVGEAPEPRRSAGLAGTPDTRARQPPLPRPATTPPAPGAAVPGKS